MPKPTLQHINTHVFLSFWISIYHFFSIFKNAPKVVKKRTWVHKRIPWEKSDKMFKTDIYLQYSQTYMWVSASKHSTWAHTRHSVHCIHFSSRALDFANPSQNANNVFVFGGSLSNKSFRVAIFVGVCFVLHNWVVFVFRFLFCIFLPCPFFYHCTLYTMLGEQKENIQIIREILNDKSMPIFGYFYLKIIGSFFNKYFKQPKNKFVSIDSFSQKKWIFHFFFCLAGGYAPLRKPGTYIYKQKFDSIKILWNIKNLKKWTILKLSKTFILRNNNAKKLLTDW